jgi:hypothetical protein
MTTTSNITEFYETLQSGHFSKKILIEGDSWVSHPFIGVENLATQIDEFKPNDYLILNIGDPGDEAKEIFEERGEQYKKLQRLISTENWGEKFDLILLSAAGNDIVGEEIRKKGYVLNKRDYPNVYGKQLLTTNFYSKIAEVVDGYDRFLQYKNNTRNSSTPIISHAYCYLTPREIGTHAGSIMFHKGWIKQHLKHQGITKDDEQYEIVCEMLDAFYLKVKELESKYSNFLMVDTRTVLLKNDKPDLSLWHDEIHPTGQGFELVAKHIREVARKNGLWPIS